MYLQKEKNEAGVKTAATATCTETRLYPEARGRLREKVHRRPANTVNDKRAEEDHPCREITRRRRRQIQQITENTQTRHDANLRSVVFVSFRFILK